jgi:hypothetical protein
MNGLTPPTLTPPYDMPLFRSAHRAVSPSGLQRAWIAQASESSMGNPSLGTLEVSDGLVLEQCNPSFLWSDCSRYLAVLQVPRTGMFFAAHVVIVDTKMRAIWRSERYRCWLQPESFVGGALLATRHFKQNGKLEQWRVSACFADGSQRPYPASA